INSPHVLHHTLLLTAMCTDRHLAAACLAADLLVQTARDDEFHALALAPAERAVTLPQGLRFRLTAERGGAALDRSSDRVQQRIIAERLCQELGGARLHRANAHRDVAMTGAWRRTQIAGSIGFMPRGLSELQPPVWCGASRISAPSSAVARAFSMMLLS